MSFGFVIGGARSGKSAFALEMALKRPGRKVYVATAAALDPEMEERIRAHRAGRGEGWTTVEEQVDLAAVVSSLSGGDSAVVDCITLWVTNLMGEGLADADIMARARSLGDALAATEASITVVSNEVGLGIVPANETARRFRDVAGSVNQALAARASEVWFVASGVPLRMR